MSREVENILRKQLGIEKVTDIQKIQSLWSGYGELSRYRTDNELFRSLIVKHIKLSGTTRHPRGWNSDISHQRKLKSYEVEINWYKNYRDLCPDECYVPKCLYVDGGEDEIILILEDLSAAGYPDTVHYADDNVIFSVLKWLAEFHANFLQIKPHGLWEEGTYWHLATRPDEYEKLTDKTLKEAAHKLSERLKSCRYQTIVHGDAKLANFCFSADRRKVAAVDFQYTGAGCGMKDVAYFFSSCLSEEECEEREGELLDFYFTELRLALEKTEKSITFDKLEKEWREMYSIAWADFLRFLLGWCPDHWKIHPYSMKLTETAIKQLQEELN